jgi:hypothetical protein
MVLLRDVPSARNDDSKFGGRNHYSHKLLAVAAAAMEAAPGHATAGTPKSTMDHTTHAHTTVNRAGDHASVRCTNWRAEMRTGETGSCEAMRRRSRAIVDRWRAAEDLHG